MTWTQLRKWSLTMTVAVSTLAVALVSSAYTGGVREIEAEFPIGELFQVLVRSLPVRA
jgi:hypothetical protein